MDLDKEWIQVGKKEDTEMMTKTRQEVARLYKKGDGKKKEETRIIQRGEKVINGSRVET